ncbi:Basement membrane-specific heparan sulfate proteoglycan core, partial [Paramuricea clavata]
YLKMSEPTSQTQKLGKCPIAPVKPECPPPVILCSIDVECRGSQKCCDDGCSGSECREAEDLRKNLLLYYDFDNMTQTHVYDRSGNGRYARMYSTNIVEEEGKCNKSITFNSQPLHITEVASPNATSVKRSSLQITVAVWILLYEGKGKRTIFTSFHASKEKKFLYFGIYKDDYLRWFATSENSCKTFEKASQLKVGAWQHVAVSYNYTNGITTCNFFVNGTLFEGKGNNKDSKLTAKNTPLGISPFIGSVNSQGGEPLNGFMDEFYIFDKALSKEEIQNLMNDTCKTNQHATTRANPRTTAPLPLLLESNILSGETLDYGQFLKRWIGGNNTWKLCWRATRDGWAAKTFHSNCDYKKRTVTLVKVGQYVFGGYATASWEGFRRWKKAGGSFIFSLRNKENLPPFTAPLKDENTWHAIYADHRYGPIFGYGHDLYIADNAIS